MGNPVLRHTEYGRSGVLVADSINELDAFIAQCLDLQKILGRAVHPQAIGRLVEVWPEAEVQVRHDTMVIYPHVPLRRIESPRTTVEIWQGEKSPEGRQHVIREARCYVEDTYDKRVGIRVAFDRCLREIVRREDPARLTGKRTF